MRQNELGEAVGYQSLTFNGFIQDIARDVQISNKIMAKTLAPIAVKILF